MGCLAITEIWIYIILNRLQHVWKYWLVDLLPECWMLIEDFSVQMDLKENMWGWGWNWCFIWWWTMGCWISISRLYTHANISSHVLRTIAEDLLGVDALGRRPRGHYVVHHPFRERLGHLVQLHELTHVGQHVVIDCRCWRHLLDYGRHVTEDGRAQQRPDHHHAYCEQLLVVRLCRDVAWYIIKWFSKTIPKVWLQFSS